jgi:hypothetical protein
LLQLPLPKQVWPLPQEFPLQTHLEPPPPDEHMGVLPEQAPPEPHPQVPSLQLLLAPLQSDDVRHWTQTPFDAQ